MRGVILHLRITPRIRVWANSVSDKPEIEFALYFRATKHFEIFRSKILIERDTNPYSHTNDKRLMRLISPLHLASGRKNWITS